ncbi:uncharacterized protein LOC116254887 [Nymphaea colorata]|uniref:Uncharacterized protein n=1 Tax=Nymphaea colorata TaxID=210225 RepID=A0A5K1DQT3_9MAGN|nr:uncharacterized protein LOC116254887 [Nymphaea colorata]
MGNSIASRFAGTGTGKVVFSDGTILEFDKPMAVAELMMEYPQQFVVEFQSVSAGKRLTPLPADKELEMSKVYYMMPMKRGRVTCSAEDANRIQTKTRFVSRSGPLPGKAAHRPRVAVAGRGCRIEGKKEEDVALKRRHDWDELVSDSLSGLPEFVSRQFSGKAWKPTLDTIAESRAEKKRRHWLF